jgi:predicted RNase H-like nuclease (RuvC/YqgF family)
MNREINELKMKIDSIKKEMTDDMENLRKKNEMETQNTVEGHHSRLEQAEDRISGLEDKWKLKEKLKSYLSNLSPVKGIWKNSPTPSKDKT